MNNHIIFFIIIFMMIINPINSQSNSKSLSSRYGHSSIYVNSIIYILGGVIDNQLSNEFISIDVSQSSLTSRQTKLNYLNDKVKMDFILPHAFAQTSLGFDNIQTTGKNTIYLFGGLQNNLFEFDLSETFSFNTVSNNWTRPTIDKIPTRKLSSFRAISSNYTNSIYTFGVKNDTSEMDLFNSTTLSWNQMFIVNSFGNVHGFTSTLLRNGVIVYFGGSILSGGNNQNYGEELFSREHSFVKSDFLNTYNTITNTWDAQATVGDFPEGRTMHSAVVTLDGRIIIYGGLNYVLLGKTSSGLDSKKYPDPLILILETFSKPFRWNKLQLGDNSMEPVQSYGHTATLVDNYMVVAFGMQANDNVATNKISSAKDFFTPSSSIYIMDTTNKTHIIWSKLENTLSEFPLYHQNFPKVQQIFIIIAFSVMGLVVGLIVFFCCVKSFSCFRDEEKAKEPPGAATTISSL